MSFRVPTAGGHPQGCTAPHQGGAFLLLPLLQGEEDGGSHGLRPGQAPGVARHGHRSNKEIIFQTVMKFVTKIKLDNVIESD